MSWIAVSVRGGTDRRDALVHALIGAGSRAVEENGDVLRTYLPAGADVETLIEVVADAAPGARLETAVAAVEDWPNVWRAGVVAHRVGRLVVAPPWLADGLDPATTVVVDPGMAFGTGEHETTRGVMRLMDAVIAPADHVADVGAGSAVLSIAAAKLGAARVAAIEVDPDAIGNAESNVRANGVADRVVVLDGDAVALLPLVAPIRVVLANIVAPVLRDLLPTIRAALVPGGLAIVGGITVDERASFAAGVTQKGWRVTADDREGDWWSAVLARP